MLEYDGTAFSGWQQQAGTRTVELELKRALKSLTGEDHVVRGAGRTDAGAHALGQVASFQLRGRLKPERLLGALNALLPPDLAVVSAEVVPDQFHARYSARRRRYRYRFCDRPARPAIERDRSWHVRTRLDEAAMTKAAGWLVGEHDWSSFCSASEPSARRTRHMREATVRRSGDYVELELVADGFLRGLVRGIAGALAEVGSGRRPPEWVGELIEARDRSRAPKTAPARGLTLMEVMY